MKVENDNEDQKLIKEEWIREMMKVVVEELEMILTEKMKRAREKDKEVVRVIEETKKVGVRNLRGNKWKIERDLVLKEGKVYMSKNEELKMEIIQLYYNTLVAEHGGRWKTTELVMRNYWWLGVTKDVGKYIEGYDIYQRMKNRTETPEYQRRCGCT